jgi:N-acetyl-gamma-glutamyl-phosphate reductase
VQELSPIRVCVVGAGGYAGAELVAALLAHPRASIVGLFASARREKGDQPGRIDELFPRFRGRLSMDVLPASVEAIAGLKPEAVFLATPHEASVELAPALLERGIVVLDLSAAYRMKNLAAYPKHYGFEHARPEVLERAVYGVPEISRAQIASADLIAVPGCYPTASILAIRPLVKAGAVRVGTRAIIDATSGVSGAGRGLSQRSLFCEVSQSPYGVLSHRHNPEIDEHAGVATLFTPHLGPFDRGILATIHIELAAGFDGAKVRGILESAYAGERFVRLLPSGSHPAVKDVAGTNFCDISVAAEESAAFGGHAILFSAIDNLLKGASGQAVQCMNARFAMPEWWGLLPEETR